MRPNRGRQADRFGDAEGERASPTNAMRSARACSLAPMLVPTMATRGAPRPKTNGIRRYPGARRCQPAMAPGPPAAPTRAVTSATVKVVCSVLIEPTAPTRRISLNRVVRSRAKRSRTRLRPDPMYQASAAAVSAVVRMTAIPAPTIPSPGIGPTPKISRGERHEHDHPDTGRQRGHEHVAGPADDAGQAIHQPDQPNTGEHHVRIEKRRLERLPLATERAVERWAEGQDQDGESQTEQQVDDDGVQHQRVSVGAVHHRARGQWPRRCRLPWRRRRASASS